MLTRLLTSDPEFRRTFGDPTPFYDLGGHITRAWEAEILTIIALPDALPLAWDPTLFARTTKVHRLVAPHLESALQAIFNRPRAWASIGDWGGCYLFRPNRRNPHELSTHCWGLGPDMGVAANPQGSPPRVDPEVRATMEAHGFLWGGSFKGASVDGMHWQFGDLSLLKAS